MDQDWENLEECTRKIAERKIGIIGYEILPETSQMYEIIAEICKANNSHFLKVKQNTPQLTLDNILTTLYADIQDSFDHQWKQALSDKIHKSIN